MTESSSFRVIIVGASVAGLTLAHCLDKAGIDYIVLEKHENVDHVSLGGFLSVQPNGAQVLSQLGLHGTVAAAGETITVCHTGFPDGFGFSDHWPDRLHKRYVSLLSFKTPVSPPNASKTVLLTIDLSLNTTDSACP